MIWFIVFVVILGIAYKSGWLDSVLNYFLDKWVRIKFIMALVNNINTGMSKSTTAFVVNDTDMSANIIYERLGKEFILSVPYNRKYVTKMTQFRVQLTRNKDTVDITQQPGIPYLVNATSLGGHSIIITNDDNDKSHEYESDTVPMYGEEVF